MSVCAAVKRDRHVLCHTFLNSLINRNICVHENFGCYICCIQISSAIHPTKRRASCGGG